MAIYKSRLIAFRVRPKEGDWLFQKASGKQVHVSEYLRELINVEIEKEKIINHTKLLEESK